MNSLAKFGKWPEYGICNSTEPTWQNILSIFSIWIFIFMVELLMALGFFFQEGFWLGCCWCNSRRTMEFDFPLQSVWFLLYMFVYLHIAWILIKFIELRPWNCNAVCQQIDIYIRCGVLVFQDGSFSLYSVKCAKFPTSVIGIWAKITWLVTYLRPSAIYLACNTCKPVWILV